MLNCQVLIEVLIEKLSQINQINCLLKMSLKYFIQVILFHFITPELLVLVMAVTFITRNLMDCLMKKLILLKCLMIVLLQTR